ncbi:MAG: hypothetical protein F2842_08205 [Actinobacteria bacterium]|nr:hypothetical protein [Actinomycetota bacterium]
MVALSLSSGSVVEVLVDGSSPHLLLHHHGTPAAGPTAPELVRAAHPAGFTVAHVVRPGYGESTRWLGRTVADNIELSAAVADHLGAERFVSLGWSGGGPHAPADAALLPERCAGALSFAGVAPFDAAGLEFLAGMGQDNIDEFGAVLAGPDALSTFLMAAADGLVTEQGADVIEQINSLLPRRPDVSLGGGGRPLRRSIAVLGGERHRWLVRRRRGVHESMGVRPRRDHSPHVRVAGL